MDQKERITFPIDRLPISWGQANTASRDQTPRAAFSSCRHRFATELS